MSSLIYELTKQTVTLERLDKLDGVFSRFRTDKFASGTPSQVYGIRPKHNFPNRILTNFLPLPGRRWYS